MAITGDGNLYVYVLNVGQADTSVVVTPTGSVMVIDAYRPAKLVRLLNSLGLGSGNEIEHLLITHPHNDHYAGASRLVDEFRIKEATFAPFWHGYGTAPPTYCKLIAHLIDQKAVCHFLSGYSRYYPDGAFGRSASSVDENLPFLELLGPSNGLIKSLQRQKAFDTNHLSVLSRLTWRRFRMIFGADAQMENWATFDSEELLNDRCQVMKAAHHGSGNGTQWERLAKLKPSLVIVSADPESKHHLPDAIGAVIFTKYVRSKKPAVADIVAITQQTGTIRITVGANGKRQIHHFQEDTNAAVNLSKAFKLDRRSKLTNWTTFSQDRVKNL